MKWFFLVIALVLCCCSCSNIPHLYLGESEGALVYEGGGRSLTVRWVHSGKVVKLPTESAVCDTILLDSVHTYKR